MIPAPGTGAVRSWERSSSWDRFSPDDKHGDRNDGRVVDFLLFATLPMAELQVADLPVSELSMGIAVGVAILRVPRTKAPAWLLLPLLALLGLMYLSAQLNDDAADWTRRMLHFVLFVALAVVAAQGRFHTRSMAKGLAVGLLVSAAAYYQGYGTDYEGRLAGLMGDPNAAGYLLATLGALALAGLPGSRMRVPLGLLFGAAVFLTFSRTSLLAVGLIIVWVIIGRKLAPSLGALLLATMIWAVTHIPVELQLVGPFADRSGSDSLRQRIAALEEVQVSDAPWYGNGPGTSYVDLDSGRFFFHSSYLSALNEGGRLALVLIVAVGAFALMALLRLPTGLRNPWYEAGIIAVAVCAVNLGEVLLELPSALALGMAATYVQSMRARPPDPATGTPTTTSLDAVRLQ
jgi:hypothetical protein